MLSIPIGLIYVVAVAMQAYYPGFALILGIPIFTVWLASFYYLVVTSQFEADPERGRTILSTVVMALAACFLVVYAFVVFATISTYDTSLDVHRAGAMVLHLVG